MSSEPIHWVGDAPTSLHGSGASSFARTSRDPLDVTCGLCFTLLTVCPHEDCPYRKEMTEPDCGNHEEWMT